MPVHRRNPQEPKFKKTQILSLDCRLKEAQKLDFLFFVAHLIEHGTLGFSLIDARKEKNAMPDIRQLNKTQIEPLIR